jgi:dolichol-phosphate mannosyltransferase
MKNIAIIIPTYNELENIERLIYKIKQKLPDSKIFIIDDSNTQEIGELIKIKNLQVNYYHRENESGRGSAVIYGLIKAVKEQKYQIFIEMDADFSHDPDELLRNIDFFITKKLDLLIASRYLPGSKIVNWSLSRRVLSKLSNFLARNLLNIQLKDFTNGFRIYSPRAIDRIISSCGNIGDGFILLSEIIVVIKNNLMQIGEIQTNFVNRERGVSSVNFKLVMASLYGIIKLAIIKKKLK